MKSVIAYPEFNMVAIKGYFDGKVFVPEEPVDLPRGGRLILHIEPIDGFGNEPGAPPSPTASGMEGKTDALQWISEHPIDDPTLPADLAVNLHHYLYGSPKRETPPR